MLAPAAITFSRLKKRAFWELLQGRAIRGASCLHATSEQECEEICGLGLGNPVAIIPIGIDLPGVPPRPTGPSRGPSAADDERCGTRDGRTVPDIAHRCRWLRSTGAIEGPAGSCSFMRTEPAVHPPLIHGSSLIARRNGCHLSRGHEPGLVASQKRLLGASMRFWRSLLVVFAVLVALGIGTWAGREWLLRSAADIWIVSDPLGPADAVAVFGGGVADRPLAAAQYYAQGWVTKILVDGSDSEAVLLELGTPGTAIETFGRALGSTYQEALALRAWAEQHNLHSVIVPTEIFSTRRVRWMLRRAFPSEFRIRVIAVDAPDYRRDDWSCRPQCVWAFKIEIIKYLYYRLRY